jgi:peptidoglycan/xylan/chitin deacetylase (PgdA/CDA1 family)
MTLSRRLSRWARHALRQERPIVLMYHRVETLPVDPWQLAVAPDRFAEQIRLLAASRTIVPLSWLATRIASGDLPRRVAAVTFDDGYIDVFEEARPALEAAGCPATVFLATGALGSPAGFWWDILARIILESPSLPATLEVDLPPAPHRILVSDSAGGRMATLMEVHALLRPAPPDARGRALADLAAQARTDAEARPRDLAMTPDQVATLASSGLVEIGAHTVTHPPMTSLGPADQLREAAESRRRCEEIVGRPVTTFAYPYGDFDRAAASAVKEAGLLSACSTVERAVRAPADPFAVPRLLAADWIEAEFRRRVLAHG